MNVLELFAGAGGGILGGHLLGWQTVCAVEHDRYRRSILMRRQNDGIIGPYPIWDDVATFDGGQWRGIVDVVSGGFPCQDISCAGRGAGITGERSGLWGHMARIVGEVRPTFVWVENSPMLTVRGAGRVLGDLAEMGYDAQWGVVSAADAIWHHAVARDCVPACDHLRERIWILAYDREAADTDGDRCGEWSGKQEPIAKRSRATDTCATRQTGTDSVGGGCNGQSGEQGERQAERGRLIEGGEAMADSEGEPVGTRLCTHNAPCKRRRRFGDCGREDGWWTTEPGVGRVATGVAHRVDRIAALGDGQVPAVVALAFRTLSEYSKEDKDETH